MEEEYFKGRGAQIKPANPFFQQSYVTEHIEGLDEKFQLPPKTQVFIDHPKNVVNKVTSPDVGMEYSINPYQGCEHGCIYCYARNSHTYWGFSAGLDFETKIVVKENAPQLLESFFLKKNYNPVPIVISGNTDCYQPLERKYKLTRKLLEIFNKYQNPVGIITKNGLIRRDTDLLMDLAKSRLVHVYFSITSLNQKFQKVFEPRTANPKKRLETMEFLSSKGVPCGVMTAPIIPSFNDHELPKLLKSAADAGALSAGYTIVRLNGQNGEIFRDWLEKNYPDRASKVWNQIGHAHGGKVNDSRWGTRIKGEGVFAENVARVFKIFRKKYFGDREMPEYNFSRFRKGGSYQLF
ncbi:MAG: PA0069 family radical SAM protein [Bacteroidota bacterium]